LQRFVVLLQPDDIIWMRTLPPDSAGDRVARAIRKNRMSFHLHIPPAAAGAGAAIPQQRWCAPCLPDLMNFQSESGPAELLLCAGEAGAVDLNDATEGVRTASGRGGFPSALTWTSSPR
jgi:hypothetical protein